MKFTLFGGELAEPDSVVDATRRLLGRVGTPDAIVAMSYDASAAEALAAAGIRTGYKGYPTPDEGPAFIEAAAALGAEMTCIRTTSLTPALVSRSHVLGVWQLPWESAANTDVDLVVGLIELGVGGLTTEVPGQLELFRDMHCIP